MRRPYRETVTHSDETSFQLLHPENTSTSTNAQPAQQTQPQNLSA